MPAATAESDWRIHAYGRLSGSVWKGLPLRRTRPSHARVHNKRLLRVSRCSETRHNNGNDLPWPPRESVFYENGASTCDLIIHRARPIYPLCLPHKSTSWLRDDKTNHTLIIGLKEYLITKIFLRRTPSQQPGYPLRNSE